MWWRREKNRLPRARARAAPPSRSRSLSTAARSEDAKDAPSVAYFFKVIRKITRAQKEKEIEESRGLGKKDLQSSKS